MGASWRPDLIPGLEGKNVIQVALGDHHAAALTSLGEVYTWGEGSHGELGLGNTSAPRNTKVSVPRRVLFPGDGEKDEDKCFVFAVTAAGCHTGALVLGDHKKREVVQVRSELHSEGGRNDGMMPGSFPPPTTTGNHPQPMAPFFRIGFAGRGSFMGRVARRGQIMRARGGPPQAGPDGDPH